MEYKLEKLEELAKPFVGTDNEAMLIESFKANFNMTDDQAKIAAGSSSYHRRKNGGMFGDI
jgi:hypothetical protein